ncbi:MAG: hypothetical protein AB1646_21075 [Thermodesulfobacteriota bacterium]
MRAFHNVRGRLVFVVVLAMLLCVVGSKVRAEAVTADSGVPDLKPMKKFFTLPNFRIGGTYDLGDEASYNDGGKDGTTLESLGQPPLRLAYIAVGTPKKDAQGKITNAVVVSPYYSGDSAFMYFYWFDGQKGTEFSKGPVVGPGKLIDTNKYYVVFLDALGLWGASKPSDGLGIKFPKYNPFDLVQANYRLLKDELGIAKVKLATGVSLGGIQSYVFAVLHPDFVEAILPIGGVTKFDSVSRWLFELMTAAMISDPVWQETKGNYYHLPKEKHPLKGMMFGWSVLGHTGLGFDFRAKQPWSVVQKEVFAWDASGDQGANLVPKGKDYDVVDLLYRNRLLDGFDITDNLSKIKAKALVLHVKNDQWLRYVNVEESTKKIAGAKLVGFEDPLAHYAVFRAPNVVADEVKAFFKEIGMQ